MQQATPDLWQQITSYDALDQAWAKVDANEGSPGGDGVTRSEFRRDRFSRLYQLRADLLSGQYNPRPYRRVSIPKKKPGYRILTIPAIRDRIVHGAIVAALTPVLEPQFEESSFAYRPGRGVKQAVARIELWRRRGFTHVIEADIVRYFDNISHELLLEKLAAAIAELEGATPVLALIAQILEHQGKGLDSDGLGLVQGSPLSPLLANLYLDALDEEIEASGVKLVRFADDFVILCKSERKAERALEHCVEILDGHRLALHSEGTRIVSFDRGFDFIGYLFLKSLAVKEKTPPRIGAFKPVKSEVTEEGIIKLGEKGSRFDQRHSVLYVIDPEHTLTVRNKSFSVRNGEGAELIAIQCRRVGRIEIGADVPFDRQAILLALESSTPFAVLDRYGQTKGVLEPAFTRKAGLHMSQARAILSDNMRLALAIPVVEARIHNQRTQLSRLNRRVELAKVSDAVRYMRRFLVGVRNATHINELMGFEGASSTAYWKAIGLLWRRDNPVFSRSRPARDPLNAAINYLTGVLERDVRAAIQAAGLHPGFALLHGTRDRHEGLLYDMMEPFRAPLTEGLPVFLFSARRLTDEMFVFGEADRIQISREGRRALIAGYEAMVVKRVNRPDGKGKLDWRAQMLWQCRSLAQAVSTGETTRFFPYRMEA